MIKIKAATSLTIIGLLLMALIISVVLDKQKDEQDSARGEALEMALSRSNQKSAFGNRRDEYKSDDGIHHRLYYYLACYGKNTGNYLSYEQIEEYLSREYEDNGDIRIYNNGRHPEIEAYVTWFNYNQDTAVAYVEQMFVIADDFYDGAGGYGAWPVRIHFRNKAVMDELIKKEADPGYVMNDEIMLAHLGGVKD